MHRPVLTIAFVLLVTLVQPTSADAGFWAWLEKWSGPGPFRARPYETLVFTLCGQDTPKPPAQNDTLEQILTWEKKWTLKSSPIARNDAFHQTLHAVAKYLDDNDQKDDVPARRYFQNLLANPAIISIARMNVSRAAAPVSLANVEIAGGGVVGLANLYGTSDSKVGFGPGHEHRSFVCGYFDLGSFRADEDPSRGFPALRATLIDVGPSARVHDGVDIGGGFGRVLFRGTGVSTSRATFTPLRVVLRPIVIAVPEKWRDQWMGLLSFYWKETYVWGQLTGADFGAPQNPWSENGELIRSFGFTLDFTAVVPTVARWFGKGP